ncbi:MAG TPA: flagellar biosynthesis anti-sigma factor FlgM [Candidatus Paenibacillus intestinavium]|nr:flagellar biosynthesis anti-sigma factor FlgM [Candidatus Paenibacillus intestinavium]
MKINDINRINGINKTYQNQTDFRKEDRKSIAKDDIQISQAAQEMLETSRTENSERTQYLNDLKQVVQSGNYYVESGKIAEKLLPFFK